MKKKYFLFILIFSCLAHFHLMSIAAATTSLENKLLECPDWMSAQINKDLEYLEGIELSYRELDRLFKSAPTQLFIVKFTIRQNCVQFEKQFEHPCIDFRIASFLSALNHLCSLVKMPDSTFFIYMHDGFITLGHGYEKFPVLVQSRTTNSLSSILIPDYEAIGSKYQVLKNKDLTKFNYPWNKKNNQLAWRGSIGQSAYDNSTSTMTPENIALFSRVKLCELSLAFPSIINAKYTFYSNECETVPYLKNFEGDWMSYNDICKYKYQILIHGNASSFSCSGWRFFSNSVVFIPESNWTQWYYAELQPFVHYIPVKSDLNDLVDMIFWAQHNDDLSRKIANNARRFAIEHLTYENHLTYLYFLLEKYSKLQFID